MSIDEPAGARSSVPDARGSAIIRLDTGAAPAVISIDWSATIVAAGSGAQELLGAEELTGRSLYGFFAPAEQAALHQLLTLAAAEPDASPEALLVGRRDDGLPAVLQVTAPAERRTGPAGTGPGPIDLVLQRWGGPVVHEHDAVPPTPSRSGPDHVLSHDARGAVRNTRNFGTIFARKVRDDAGEPVTGADGRPLPVEMLDTSLRAAASADEMLDRVVWFMRLETDPLVVAPLGLADLVDAARRAARATCDELAEAAGLPELAAPLPVELAGATGGDPLGPDPAGVDPATVSVLGDREQLTWCLAELLVNARKFAGPDGRVDLTVAPADPWVHLQVRSTGRGIDPALVEDAFKLGRMLQPRGERPGVGMGLPLCRRILTRHGGRLTGSAAAPDASVFDLVLLSSLPTHRG